MRKTPLRKVSKRRASVLKAEKQLIQRLLERCEGLCEDCHKRPDWRGLSKHEIIFRSRGGDPLDSENTVMLCGRCHAKRHYQREAI